MEPISLIPQHSQHLEITYDLFDELISNENSLDFSESSVELSNIHVPSPDNKIQSLVAFSDTTAVFNMTFLQDSAPSPSLADSFICPQQMNYQALPAHLVSPVTPKSNVIHPLQTTQCNDPCFSPLSSPALPPTPQHCHQIHNGVSKDAITNESTRLLHQQLAQIEAQQKRLRDQMSMTSLNPSYRNSPFGSFQNAFAPHSPISNDNPSSFLQKIAHAGPSSKQLQDIGLSATPATPASLMNMNYPIHNKAIAPNIDTKSCSTQKGSPVQTPIPTFVHPQPAIAKKRKLAPSSPHPYTRSPRVLKPLLSPFLQPDLNIMTQPQPVRLETRRCAHKVAEQKRRDTLKEGFDSLREEIADILILDSGQPAQKVREEKEKQVKFMSKVLLLQHSYEYIVRLKTDSQLKDEKLSRMQLELDQLRKLASSKASVAATLSVMNDNEN
ncbi:uncharacterized protein ATC70_012741 [Mucor velutinosus]|uniref:BHLH domain-containing protein n=1 Tax=Mucor velutinosus TaxID=708070 RepID=A0AAN7DBH9_9FUNG|nr:hypothetical protein ATC70_012741 [Mucor velutinosus]